MLRDISVLRNGSDDRFGDVTRRTSALCVGTAQMHINSLGWEGKRGITCECASTYGPREHASRIKHTGPLKCVLDTTWSGEDPLGCH